MALRTVGVKLAAEISGYVNNIRNAGKVTKDFVGDLDKAARAGHLDAVASQAGRMGFGLTAAFGLAVGAAAKFDKQMSAVSAATHAGAADMEQLRQAALDAGKATSFSATEAAQGIEELSKAGIATTDVLGGGLSGALDLAAAGGLSVAESAETAASAMTQFKLSGKDVPHIADLLAAGAGKAQGNVHMMSMALNQSGLVAAQMGMSIEETVGTLAAFAHAGLLGSDAGTSLKTSLIMLANPTDKAAGLMKELGLKVYDAQGNFIGTTKLAGQLQEKLGGLTQEQRNAALATIFGSDAIRAASILYERGANGIQEWTEKVDEQGYAADTAAKKTDNLLGDIERLTGSVETLAIESGSGANGGLRSLVQWANSAVDAFGGLPGPVQSTLTIIAGVGGVSLLAVAGLIKLKSTTGEAMQALRDIGPTGEKAAAGLGKVGSIAGKAFVWALALTAAYEGAKLFIEFLNSGTAPTTRNVDELTASLKRFADTGKVTGELATAFGSNLQDLTRKYDELVASSKELPHGLSESGSMLGQLGRGMVETGEKAAGLNDKFEQMSRQAAEDFGAVDKAMAELVRSGGMTQAKIVFEELEQRWTAAGKPLAELRRMFPEYSKAASEATSASSSTAQGFGNVEQNARTMNRSLQDAIDAGQTLKDVFDQLNGGALGWAKAEIDLQGAIDDASASIKDNGKTLDAGTEAGRKNRESLLGIVDATRDAIQAKYDETGSVQDATAVYEQGRQALINSAIQAGLTRQQAEALANAWLRMPDLVQTGYSTPGLTDAQRRAEEYNNALSKVPRTVTTYFRTVSASGKQYQFNRWGGLYEHAAEGKLREASIASPSGPARYAYAEPATGGELFAPKYGDMNRIRGLVSHAVENWWGGWGNFVPGGGNAMSMVPGNAMGFTGAVPPVNIAMNFSGGGSGSNAAMARLFNEALRTGAIQLTVTSAGKVTVR